MDKNRSGEQEERLFLVSDTEDEQVPESQPDVGAIVSSVYDILRVSSPEDAGKVCDILGRLLRLRPRLFYGRMTINNKGRYGVSVKGINIIPEMPNVKSFRPLLLSFSGEEDDFGYRLFETVTRVYRSEGRHKKVIFLSPVWDQSVYRLAAADIELQKRRYGTEYIFITVTDSGASTLIP